MVDEVIVERKEFTLKALGVKATFNPFYWFLTIHLPDPIHLSDQREIRMGLIPETAEKVKNCLMGRKKCEFTKEYFREDYTQFSRFSFDFGQNGAQITIIEGEQYPVVESLQPEPKETKLRVNNIEIIGIVGIIIKFLELRKKFSVVREPIEKEIEKYLEEQKKKEDELIRRLAEKFQVDPADVREIFKDTKNSFGFGIEEPIGVEELVLQKE